jgi:hypothetical protein
MTGRDRCGTLRRIASETFRNLLTPGLGIAKVTESAEKKPRVQASPATDLQRSGRRAVFFISGDAHCYSEAQFLQLPDDARRSFRRGLEHWIANAGRPPLAALYHGWDKNQYGGEYVSCFVFKAQSKNANRRIYGFLANPSWLDRRFQVFVPTAFVLHKNQDHADQAQLKRVLGICNDADVKRAIEKLADEIKEGKR